MNEVFICSCRNVLAESKNSSRPYTSLPLCVWCELPWSVYKGCDNICVTPLASTKHGHEYRSRIAHFYISLSLPRNSLGELFRSVYLCIIHPYITFDHACILIIHWITLSFTRPKAYMPHFLVCVSRLVCVCICVCLVCVCVRMQITKSIPCLFQFPSLRYAYSSFPGAGKHGCWRYEVPVAHLCRCCMAFLKSCVGFKIERISERISRFEAFLSL